MVYELRPDGKQKSFYGKALVYVENDGTQHLISYGHEVMVIRPDKLAFRCWNPLPGVEYHGWSATTGKHIKAFSGLNKAEYYRLEEVG